MELQEVVRKRRMVRRFRPDPVDGETLERILATALRGPSAGFSQGIDLVVVTEPDLRAKVLDAVLGDAGAPFTVDAPVLVVITADEQRYHETYAQVRQIVEASGREFRWPVPYWYVDAGAALMLLLLAAIDEGLSAGLFGNPEHVERLRDVLGLPPNAVPVGVVAIGHDAEDASFRAMFKQMRSGRTRRTDAIHRERW